MVVEFLPAVGVEAFEASWAAIRVVVQLLVQVPPGASDRTLLREVRSLVVLPIVGVETGELVVVDAEGTELAFELKKEKIQVQWQQVKWFDPDLVIRVGVGTHVSIHALAFDKEPAVAAFVRVGVVELLGNSVGIVALRVIAAGRVRTWQFPVRVPAQISPHLRHRMGFGASRVVIAPSVTHFHSEFAQLQREDDRTG